MADDVAPFLFNNADAKKINVPAVFEAGGILILNYKL